MNKNSTYGQPSEEEHRIGAHRRDRRERDEAHAAGEALPLARLKDVGKNLGQQIQAQLKERPYVVIGAAVGIGFAAGSIFGSRLGQIALAVTGGYLLRNAYKDSGKMQRMVKEGIEKLAGEKGG